MPPPTITPLLNIISSEITDSIDSIQAMEDYFPGAIIIHDLTQQLPVYVSRWGLDYLGVTLKELLAYGPEYHSRFFNPEDVKDYNPRIIDLFQGKLQEEFITFFQQVRRSPQHDYVWFLSATKVLHRNDKGAPLFSIVTAIPVDTQHYLTHKIQRLLEENNFLRSNYHLFNTLTKREREILRFMAKGVSSEEMAVHLYISPKTINTHRRNIKSKLNIESNYDIVRFAQAFDLI